MANTENQTFNLRWHNHKTNLVEILDALIKRECYVDCTIVVDQHKKFKAHRVVLAANSPYFQAILQDVPMDHCSILFPDVKEFEMRALLEFMYTGEVNVTQTQMQQIMKIAHQLEIKGLTEDIKGKFDSKPTSSQHSMHPEDAPAFDQPPQQYRDPVKPVKTPPVLPSSNNVTSAAQSSSSPPYTNFKPFPGLYSRSPVHSADRVPWPLSGSLNDSPISSHHGLLSRVYESAPDNNPLKRKKVSSMNSMMQSSMDTPILRNVLAQSAPDSSQTMPLLPGERDASDRDRERRDDRASNHSNGNEYGSEKKYRPEAPHSPFTDKSFEDDSMEQSPSFSSDSRIASYIPQQNQKPEWKRYKQYTRSHLESAIDCVKQGMSALQAARKFGVPSRTLYDKVKKMGITTGRPMNRTMKRSPSNGGTPMPFPYGLSGANHHYPEMPSQGMGPDDERNREREMCPLPPTIPPHAAALLGQSFLTSEFNPMQAMAFAAAAHAAANGIATSPGTGARRSPSPNLLMKYMRPASTEIERMHREEQEREEREMEHERKREMRERDLEMRERDREIEIRRHEMERERERERERTERNGGEREREEEDEEVEDLSMARKIHLKRERSLSLDSPHRSPSPTQQASPPSHVPTSGVIVPPLSQVIQRLTKSKMDDFNENENREVLSKAPPPHEHQAPPLESNL